VNEFLSERQLPVVPGTFAMSELLSELNGVATAHHSHGLWNADTFNSVFFSLAVQTVAFQRLTSFHDLVIPYQSFFL